MEHGSVTFLPFEITIDRPTYGLEGSLRRYPYNNGRRIPHSQFPLQSEDGERMRKLRDILDRTVDKLVAKLEQNHFINNMPKVKGEREWGRVGMNKVINKVVSFRPFFV